MNMIRTLVQKEPAATCTVLSWVSGAVCALAGHPEFAPVLVAVGLAFLGVRSQVTPAKEAQKVTMQTATTAALEVARNLTASTAGAAGEITGDAAQVVDDAVGLVSQLVGKGAR